MSGGLARRPKGERAENLAPTRRMDEFRMDHPFDVGQHRIRRLMGMEAAYPCAVTLPMRFPSRRHLPQADWLVSTAG